MQASWIYPPFEYLESSDSGEKNANPQYVTRFKLYQEVYIALGPEIVT